MAATYLSVPAVNGTYGGSVNLSAILNKTADNSPVSGETVSFTLNGVNLGSAVTDSSGTATLSNISLAGIGANTYPAGIQPSFAGDANFQGSSGTGQLTVNRANAKIVVTPYSVTYDGNAHTATGTATGVNSESLSGLDLSGTTHTNAGTYGIDAWTFTDSTGNYNNVSVSQLVFDSIAKANAVINVTPYSVTYDGNAHTATGTATGVKGETLSGLNLSGTTHTNAGTYGIDAWTFTDSTGNYNNVSVSQLVFDSITPAPLSVVANNASRGYGQPNPLFGPSYIGFVNGENASVLAGRLTCSSPATPSSPVAGSPYAITCSGLTSSNYAITYAAGALTITAAPLTITANNATRGYGQPNPPFGPSYSGFVNGENASVLAGTLTCVSPATPSSPVAGSPYAISCSGLTSSNYAITYAAGALTITAAPLTITANSTSKILNAPLPAFGASYSGFVNGEGPSVLTGSLSCTTTATATSPVGSYPITCSGLTAANYAISWTAGTLKVMYAPAGVCGHVILPPIDPAGATVGNQGRTIPAKFQVCDANGVSIGTPGVVTGFLLTQIITGTATTNVEDIVDTNNPDTAFRWDGTEWIFNITTQNLAAGSTYVYTIVLNDGSTIVFQFGLR